MNVLMDLCWLHGVLSFRRKLGKDSKRTNYIIGGRGSSFGVHLIWQYAPDSIKLLGEVINSYPKSDLYLEKSYALN